MKCAICNKELNGGLVVDKECLEKLQNENYELAGMLKGFEKGSEMLRANISELQAENAELKALNEKLIKSGADLGYEIALLKAMLEKPKKNEDLEYVFVPNKRKGIYWICGLDGGLEVWKETFSGRNALARAEARLKELEEK